MQGQCSGLRAGNSGFEGSGLRLGLRVLGLGFRGKIGGV